MIDLNAQELSIIQRCARAYFSPGTTIWAFGSRVNGTSHDTSDLDLVVHAPASQTETDAANELTDFKEALQNSNLAILVDVFQWDSLPKHFQVKIEQDYELLDF